MKQIVFLIIVAFLVFISGCEKCECDPDEYYIKYAVGVQSNTIWVPIDIEIINEYGDKVASQLFLSGVPPLNGFGWLNVLLSIGNEEFTVKHIIAMVELN